MRFSQAANVSRKAEDDWFDPVLEQDSPLYIDPYLLFEDADPFWAGSYDEVVEFFETAASLVIASGGARNTPAWRKAIHLMTFPEPHEFALGVSLGSPRGSGTGPEFATRMAEVLALVGPSRASQLASIGGFALFCEGIGVDRISDILGNILKKRFVAYTQAVLARHDATATEVRVKHIRWSAQRRRWEDGVADLFANDVTGGGVLLVPERFLKDIPRIEANQFWDWASLSESSLLRDDLNFDLSESLTKSQKVTRARIVARERPEIAFRYLRAIEGQDHHPYDVTRDAKGLVGWYEGGIEALSMIAGNANATTPPASSADFNAWVLALAKDFQFAIEETDAWRLLWDDHYSNWRPEKIAQAVAGVMWRVQCKAANVDLNKETNIGRGPVDFKFSQGWERRALIEVKYIASTHFAHGAEKQLPQYLRSEEITFGVYLAIGFTDGDFERPRIQRVQETCKALSDQLDREIKLVVVDARPKKSASKV